MKLRKLNLCIATMIPILLSQLGYGSCYLTKRIALDAPKLPDGKPSLRYEECKQKNGWGSSRFSALCIVSTKCSSSRNESYQYYCSTTTCPPAPSPSPTVPPAKNRPAKCKQFPSKEICLGDGPDTLYNCADDTFIYCSRQSGYCAGSGANSAKCIYPLAPAPTPTAPTTPTPTPPKSDTCNFPTYCVQKNADGTFSKIPSDSGRIPGAYLCKSNRKAVKCTGACYSYPEGNIDICIN